MGHEGLAVHPDRLSRYPQNTGGHHFSNNQEEKDKALFTAVVGGVMDGLGLRRQFLPPQVQPIRADMVLIGRAMPVLEADVVEIGGGGSLRQGAGKSAGREARGPGHRGRDEQLGILSR